MPDISSNAMIHHDGGVMRDYRGKPVYKSQFLSTHPLMSECHEKIGYAGEHVVYMSGDAVIRNLNLTFGYDGWSTEITRERVVQCEKEKSTWVVGYVASVKLTLKSGVSHEDCGCAEARCESKTMAHDHAMKSAVTDAVNRAARHFGERLGNALSIEGNPLDNAPMNNKKALEQLERVEETNLFGRRNQTDTNAGKIMNKPSRKLFGYTTDEIHQSTDNSIDDHSSVTRFVALQRTGTLSSDVTKDANDNGNKRDTKAVVEMRIAGIDRTDSLISDITKDGVDSSNKRNIKHDVVTVESVDDDSEIESSTAHRPIVPILNSQNESRLVITKKQTNKWGIDPVENIAADVKSDRKANQGSVNDTEQDGDWQAFDQIANETTSASFFEDLTPENSEKNIDTKNVASPPGHFTFPTPTGEKSKNSTFAEKSDETTSDTSKTIKSVFRTSSSKETTGSSTAQTKRTPTRSNARHNRSMSSDSAFTRSRSTPTKGSTSNFAKMISGSFKGRKNFSPMTSMEQ